MNDLVKRLHLLSNDLAEMEDTIGDKFTLPNEAAAELTRLRERNAELEKERDALSKSLTDAVAGYERDMAEDDTRVASLEATVRELREALVEARTCIATHCPGGLPTPLADCTFKRIDAALAASESVVKSGGEKDGVE